MLIVSVSLNHRVNVIEEDERVALLFDLFLK